jgi:hypothetical protein
MQMKLIQNSYSLLGVAEKHSPLSAPSVSVYGGCPTPKSFETPAIMMIPQSVTGCGGFLLAAMMLSKPKMGGDLYDCERRHTQKNLISPLAGDEMLKPRCNVGAFYLLMNGGSSETEKEIDQENQAVHWY